MALKRETVVLDPEATEDSLPQAKRVWLAIALTVGLIVIWMLVSSGSDSSALASTDKATQRLKPDVDGAEVLIGNLEEQARRNSAEAANVAKAGSSSAGEFAGLAQGLPALPVDEGAMHEPARTRVEPEEKTPLEQLRSQQKLEGERRAFDELQGALAAPIRGTSTSGFGGRQEVDERGEEGAVSPAAMALVEQSLASLGNHPGALPPGIGSALGHMAAKGEEENAQAAQMEFFRNGAEQVEGGVLLAGRQRHRSPYVLLQGGFFSAALETPINSDLPGQIRARVSQNVYDTTTGKYLLVPSGATLVGTYSSTVRPGQDRVQVAWTRLVYPDGSFQSLGSMPGGAVDGMSGVKDKVNRHIGRLFGVSLLMAVPLVTYEITAPTQPQSVEGAVHRGVGNSVLNAGSQLLEREANIPPTIEIRAGTRFLVHVNKDMVFDAPYEDGHQWRVR